MSIDLNQDDSLRNLALMLASLAVPPSVAAQATPPANCNASAYRALDYWVGEWEVRDTTGQLLGIQSVTRVAGGCALAEHWRPPGGGEGRSLSWFRATDSTWHQAYVDATTWMPRYRGRLMPNGEVEMEESPDEVPSGAPITRMRYIKKPNNEVQQVLWSSTDRGATWTLGWVGNYRRR